MKSLELGARVRQVKLTDIVEGACATFGRIGCGCELRRIVVRERSVAKEP